MRQPSLCLPANTTLPPTAGNFMPLSGWIFTSFLHHGPTMRLRIVQKSISEIVHEILRYHAVRQIFFIFISFEASWQFACREVSIRVYSSGEMRRAKDSRTFFRKGLFAQASASIRRQSFSSSKNISFIFNVKSIS